MSRLPTASCPCCRYEGDITAFLVSDEARQAINALAQTNPVVHDWLKPMMLYVRLFAPVGEQLGYKMMARLFGELSDLIGPGKVVHKGMTYATTPPLWQRGFDTVRECKTLNLPLTNHSYLLGVVGNMAMDKAVKAERKLESDRAKGHHRARGYTSPVDVNEGKTAQELTPEERAKRDAIRAKALAAAGINIVRD